MGQPAARKKQKNLPKRKRKKAIKIRRKRKNPANLVALKSPNLQRSKPKNNNSSQKIEIDLVLLYWIMIEILIIVENLMIDQEILTIHKIVQEIPTNQHHMIVVVGIIMTVT